MTGGEGSRGENKKKKPSVGKMREKIKEAFIAGCQLSGPWPDTPFNAVAHEEESGGGKEWEVPSGKGPDSGVGLDKNHKETSNRTALASRTRTGEGKGRKREVVAHNMGRGSGLD